MTRSDRTWFVWVLLVPSAAAFAIGHQLGLFGRVWYYDNLLHSYSSLALAAVVSVVLARRVNGTGGLLRAALVVSVVVTLGVAWEMFEWILATVRSAGAPGYYDTMMDLSMDTVGAVVGALLSLWLVPAHRYAPDRPQSPRVPS